MLCPTIQYRERIDPGAPVYPTVFNVAVDVVVMVVLLEVFCL